MKITAPLSSPNEADELFDLKIDEVYFGLNFNRNSLLNRRPSKLINMRIEDALNIIIKAKAKKIETYLAINDLIYNNNDFSAILSGVHQLTAAGLNGIIIADLNLLIFLRDKIPHHLKLILSTCTSVYNNRTIAFYKKFNISRIVLPRHLTLDEIEFLVKSNSDLEFEVIIMNSKCINDDGMCSFEHGLHNFGDPNLEGGGCQLSYSVKLESGNLDELDRKIITKRFEKIYQDTRFACGACSLYRLNKIGIHSCKIVGREFNLSRKIKDISLIAECIKQENLNKNSQDYQDFIRNLYINTYGTACQSNQCYY